MPAPSSKTMVVAWAPAGEASQAAPGKEAERAMLFHHVQMFVKSLKPLSEYKALEKRLNSLSAKGHFDPFSGGMRFLEEHAHQASEHAYMYV